MTKLTFTTQVNEEHKGIEITFSAKPYSNVISKLKAYGFRWHRIKKCWYAKQSDKVNAFVSTLSYLIQITEEEIVDNNVILCPEKSKTPVNKYGIKVGDIFYSSWGYEQTNIDFYQVIALKGTTMATLRKINHTSRNIGFCSDMVKPIPDSFAENSEPFTRKINSYSNVPGCNGRKSYETLYLTDVNTEHNATSYY